MGDNNNKKTLFLLSVNDRHVMVTGLPEVSLFCINIEASPSTYYAVLLSIKCLHDNVSAHMRKRD